jgi:predicted MFS family arabinose efflux permease
MLSTYFFSRIRDPQVLVQQKSNLLTSAGAIWKDLRSSPYFLGLCIAGALWNFFVSVVSPFFNVYMVQDLKFTVAMVGITVVATSVSKLLVQHKVGELSDRWGSRRIMAILIFPIPTIPLAWIYISQLWQVVVLNIFGGLVWGAFDLVSFTFLLHVMLPDQRARYLAIYQVFVFLAVAGGAALGSSIILAWRYEGIFITSAVGRFVAALIFLGLAMRFRVRQGNQTEPPMAGLVE